MRNMERKPIPAGPDAPPGSLAAALATVPDPRRPYMGGARRTRRFPWWRCCR